MTAKHITKIVSLCGELKNQVPEYLDILSAIAKVEGSELAIKKNQSLVMKYIMQSYSSVANILEKPIEAK